MRPKYFARKLGELANPPGPRGEPTWSSSRIGVYASPLESLGYVHLPHPDDSFAPFFYRPATWPHTHHVPGRGCCTYPDIAASAGRRCTTSSPS